MLDIIIPAFNCSSTLGRTLSSLVAQTDTNFGVIIVDDCSTEDIKSIVNEYSNKLNIRYIRNQKNLGCGMSRQVGIDNTKCKFITFLDSDDLFMPYTVETFNSIIEKNNEIEYIHSYFYEQYEKDGAPAMFLHKENYTACHGKLYNVELIRKYEIKNSPEVRWADDSYFNSMCAGLMNISLVRIPMMLWCNNKHSITRREDAERDKNLKEDFLNAMIMSSKFIVEKNGVLGKAEPAIRKICETYKDSDKINQLLQYIGGNYNGL